MRRFLAQTPARARRSSRVAAAVGGVAVAALASGCAFFSPVQTEVPYNPADGVPANVGELALRDLVLVGNGDGSAMVSGSAINLGTQNLDVQVAVAPDQAGAQPPAGAEVSLGPREQVNLGTKGLRLEGVTAKPGMSVKLNVSSPQAGTTVVSVPVLEPALYYSTITPTPTAG